METYFTIDEVARYLNFAEKTIRKWVLNRDIPFIKINQTIRFRLSEIEKWVDEKKRQPLSCLNNDSADVLFNDSEDMKIDVCGDVSEIIS